MSKEGAPSPAPRSVRVSLAGLDLSTPDGARDARERIRKTARDLCAQNLGHSSLESCVEQVGAAAQRQIKARTAEVSLADLDLDTPEGAQAARDRLRAAAQRVCQEPQAGSHGSSSQYATCVDETFAQALRRAHLLRPMSGDF
ncbi:MAG: UrcA family protein [Gammaproteobacteria bacterium]|nr:UrcA family protein [Gammaproteobacteria bacterium]